MKTMKTILITGGHGFIGSALTNALRFQNRYKILAPTKLELNLLDKVKIAEYAKQADTIIHLGGISNPGSSLQNTELFDINIGGTQSLLEHAKIDSRFIFASSIVVTGNAFFLKNEASPQTPLSLYAASKAAAENLIFAYSQIGRIRGISLRLCATVGLGLTHGCLYDFINQAKTPEDNFFIMGQKPGSSKPYCHINDVVRAILLSIENNTQGPINIVNEDVLTIEDVADIVLNYYNINKYKIWTGANFIGDNPMLKYSNELAKTLLRWQPTLNSREAIFTALEDLEHGTK